VAVNAEAIIELIRAEQLEHVESQWVAAVEADMPIKGLVSVLEALVAAEQLDLAETLGWELLAERTEQLSGEALLEVAREVVSAVADSDELRGQAAELYRSVHGEHEHFDALLGASGLLEGQAPRRAFRTLRTCLAITPGGYLANRFDHQVIRATAYQAALGEFEAVDAQGKSLHMEPRTLADEFEVVPDSDFRVLCQHRPGELAALLQSDPAAVLMGVCMSAGGKIDANALKEHLVPAYLAKEQWARWWGRARTAAKRSEQLSLAGRPIVVTYHPGGRTLEEELAEAAAGARMPLELLAVLQQYVREARTRKVTVDPEFVAPLLATLAKQAADFADYRTGDALAASLAIGAAVAMALPAPAEPFPAPEAILGGAEKPELAVAHLTDPALWPAALEAMGARSDAADRLADLLAHTPVNLLEEVAGRVRAAGRADALADAAAEAAANPRQRFELFLWLWRGPKTPPPGLPGKVELLRRLFDLLRELAQDLDIQRDELREQRQRIRSALSAEGYAAYKQAVDEMDEGVAATVKNRITLVDGLGQSVREELLNILRQRFYALFIKEKVAPWLDKAVLWTSQAGLTRRNGELKEIMEVKIPANADAIGAAAAHGDLSENSEWKFAIEERDLLQAQAMRIGDELTRARVLHVEDVPDNSVTIGSRVTLCGQDDGQTTTVTVLGPWDTDLDNHVYNYQTPLAQALLGRAIGEEVTLRLGGQQALYRIERLASAIQ